MKKESFQGKVKCKHGYCSPMSNSAWCALNNGGDILKLHDMSSNSKCNSQKQRTFLPTQFQLEGS